MKRLRLASGVEDEIRAAARWYDAQCAGLGADLREAVERAIDGAQAHPESCAPAAGARGARRAFVQGFPFNVVFLDRPDEILVLACRPQRAAPEVLALEAARSMNAASAR